MHKHSIVCSRVKPAPQACRHVQPRKRTQVKALYDHFVASKVTIDDSTPAPQAVSDEDVEAGSVLLAIPETHLLTLDQVNKSPLQTATKGALWVYTKVASLSHFTTQLRWRWFGAAIEPSQLDNGLAEKAFPAHTRARHMQIKRLGCTWRCT